MDIEGVGELEVEDYTSKGYREPAKIREVKKAKLLNLDFEAPKEILKPVLEEMFRYLKTTDEPKKSRIMDILKTLAPYVGAVGSILSILQKYRII